MCQSKAKTRYIMDELVKRNQRLCKENIEQQAVINENADTIRDLRVALAEAMRG